MKLKTFIILIFAIFFTGCGFKVVNQNYLNDYKLTEINISGDNRISYLLKNKLKIFNQTGSKDLKMDIKINKIKNINEKNIQNQITKYEILITVNVKFYITEKNLMNNFTITKSGVYSVNDRYSETVNNEKRLVKNMVNNINDQILKNLRTKLNDI